MALSACPSCDSEFLQPLRCEPKDDDEVLVELRCPECMTHLQAPFSRADMAELDRRQSAWRDEIVAYERSVSESMEASLFVCAAWRSISIRSARRLAVVPSRRPRLPAGS